MDRGKDPFDEALGKEEPMLGDRGYDEANDYDREIEKPENVKWDDEAWVGFKKSFSQIEKENMGGTLTEGELARSIGEENLGEEIRRAVDGKAGI